MMRRMLIVDYPFPLRDNVKFCLADFFVKGYRYPLNLQTISVKKQRGDGGTPEICQKQVYLVEEYYLLPF